jgi:hypothetical protein
MRIILTRLLLVIPVLLGLAAVGCGDKNPQVKSTNIPTDIKPQTPSAGGAAQ